jgi:methionyl-tRNA formyltransferase
MPSDSAPTYSSPVRYQGWRIALLSVAPDVVVSFGQLLQDRGHEVVAVVMPPGPEGPVAQNALKWSVIHRVIQEAPRTADILIASKRSRLAPLLKAVQPDLLLTFFFPWRVPAEALAVPTQGAINVHPSLLPRYRGPNPLGWTLRNGDPEVGLTFHRMEPQFDTGPILAQGSQPISDEESVDAIATKVMDMSLELLPQALSRVAWGDVGEPQSEAEASQAGHFEDAYREINWSEPARAVHRRVRACRMSSWRDGVPCVAMGTLEGHRLQVITTSLLQEAAPERRAEPGSVLERQGASILVQCGDGPLWITQSEPWSG